MTSVRPAYEEAIQSGLPKFHPIGPYADDRGWSYMNLFLDVLTPSGQINFSEISSGAVKAWHRHERQTDLWLVVSGMLKVVVYSEKQQHLYKIMLGIHHPGILIIPRGLWHGCVNLTMDPVGLMYYMDQRFIPQEPDEFRQPWDWEDPILYGGAWYGIEPK